MARLKQKERFRFVLSIGDEGAILTCFSKRKLVKRLFVNSPSSSEYLEMLAASPKAPVYVLVDVVDQAYIQHSLPPVSSLNVGKLVSRKLAKDFDDIDLKSAIPLGREKSGRKDWNFLFVSLRNIPPFSDWIDAISNLPNHFGGVYLLPLESTYYLKDLQRVTSAEKGMKPSGWQILVSHNRVGGFRQVVFRNNKIIFTRIAQPIGGQTADIVAGNIEQETLNTIEYIRRLGYDDSEGLDVYIVVAADVKNVLELGVLHATNRIVLTPREIATKLAFEDTAEDKDRFGDVVAAAHFITSKKHVLKLRTPYTDKLAKMELFSMFVRATGTLAILGMLGYSGYSFVQSGSIAEEISSLQKQQATQRQTREENKSKWQKFSQNPEFILAMAKMDEAFSKNSLMPLDFIQRYSKAAGSVNVLARDLALQMSDQPNTPPLSGKIQIALPSGEAHIDQKLDAFERYKSAVTGQIPDFTFTFPTLLQNEVNVTEKPDAASGSVSENLEVGFSGPATSNANPAGVPGMGGQP